MGRKKPDKVLSIEEALETPELQDMVRLFVERKPSIERRIAEGGWNSLSATDQVVAFTLGLKPPDVH